MSAPSSGLSVQTHTLSLQSPGLPSCLLQIVLLQSQTMLWLGQAGSLARLGIDWSVAMPGLLVSTSALYEVCV